jgi:hypothetical protein
MDIIRCSGISLCCRLQTLFFLLCFRLAISAERGAIQEPRPSGLSSGSPLSFRYPQKRKKINDFHPF